MKKIISLISAIAMIVSAGTATVTANAEETYLKGDFNSDGVVDYTDAQDFLHAYACAKSEAGNNKNEEISDIDAYVTEIIKKENNMDDAKAESLDMTGDGYLDAKDVVYIIRYDVALHLGYTGEFEINAVNSYYDSLDQNKVDTYFEGEVEAYKKAHPNQPAPEPELKPSFGDVNGDGKVDSKDATAVLRYYAASLTSQEEKVENSEWIAAYGDYNKDGVVDSKDAVEIIKVYADFMAGK